MKKYYTYDALPKEIQSIAYSNTEDWLAGTEYYHGDGILEYMEQYAVYTIDGTVYNADDLDIEAEDIEGA